MLVKCLCGTSITIESRHLGNKIACPKCKRTLRVASGNSDSAVAPSNTPTESVSPSATPIGASPGLRPSTFSSKKPPGGRVPKLNTSTDDLPMRLRAPSKQKREGQAYYRPGPKKESNETFKFLVVCGVFLVGLCILGGFGLIGLAINKQINTDDDPKPVVAKKIKPAEDKDKGKKAANDFSTVAKNTSPKPATNRTGIRAHQGGAETQDNAFSAEKLRAEREAKRKAILAERAGASGTTPSESASGSRDDPDDEAAHGTEKIVKGNGEGFQADEHESVVRSFATGGTSIMGLHISPDQKYLGANTLDGVVYVFDLKAGTMLYKIVSNQTLIRAIAFCDTTSLYTITDQESDQANCIAIRRPEDGSKTATKIGLVGNKRASNLAVSMDGRSVFASWKKTYKELPTGQTSTLPPDAKFWRFSALGDEVKVFDLANLFRDTSNYRPRLPSCSKFSPNGSVLVNGFADGWIASSSGKGSTMNLANSKLLHVGRVIDIDISSDGEKMVSGCEAVSYTHLTLPTIYSV